MNTYAAWWPIEDDTATLSQLTAEALPDLTRMTHEAGLVTNGPVKWATDDRDAGLVLLAVVPVEPLNDDDLDDEPEAAHFDPRHRKAHNMAEDIEFLLESDPGLTSTNIGDRFGIAPGSIYKSLGRIGRDDLRDRLIRNTDWANGGTPNRALVAPPRRTA